MFSALVRTRSPNCETNDHQLLKALSDEHFFFTDLCAYCITLVGRELPMALFNQSIRCKYSAGPVMGTPGFEDNPVMGTAFCSHHFSRGIHTFLKFPIVFFIFDVCFIVSTFSTKCIICDSPL